MSNIPTITFVPCCAPGDNYARFIGSSIVGMSNNSTWVYTGTSVIQGEGSGPWTQLIPGQCYTVFYNNISVPITTPVFTLDASSFSNSSIYFPSGKTCEESSYCQRACIPECFKLWPCDGSIAPFTTSTDLSGFIGNNIIVSSLDPSYNIDNICVFVENISNNNCANAIDIVIDANSCECPCTCYTIIGEIKSLEWIDCYGVYNSVATPLAPFEICAGAYPLALPLFPNNPLQIISNGLCSEITVLNDETCEEITEFQCYPPPCYLLEDCLDSTNVIYSNSPSLFSPASLGQVVTIAGYTECWKVLISQTCECPINVTVLTTSACCLTCLPNINYKLTLCEDPLTFVYTSNDLSLYIDKVVRREDCPGCWQVTQIDGNIPTDLDITVIEDYLDCEKCNRKYYLLQDCLGLELDVITYTDLSNYVDKVITLDWCPETCWEVTETIIDDTAGIISDVLNSYNECIDCLTNAPCICSTIKNYNDITLTYKYLDCEGALQEIRLDPGQKSDRLCLIRWYAPEPCDELIVTITSSVGVVSNIILYQSSAIHPGPVIVNDKPTWKDAGNTLYVYYDGTKWILSKNLTPLVLPFVYTPIGFINCNEDCDCPTGTWQQSSSIPNQDVYITNKLKYTIEYFGNCINGVCPPRKNKQKSVTPGYDTPGCEAWKYEEISCRAAEAMYKQVLHLRYGISNCCPDEDEQYIVQKELIDLAALNDPAYPCSTNSCGCSCDCDCSTTEPVCPVCNNAFITTWETTGAMESIVLPYFTNGTYTGTIDWGDNTTDSNSYANSIHTYATAGIYTVTICGDIVGWNFSSVPNSKLNIRSVLQWGQLRLGTDIGSYFSGCSNLDLSSVSDTLDLTGITDLQNMFINCTSLISINNINSWSTSTITNMSNMFNNCNVFNQALSFNTSAVTDMNFMFSQCFTFNSPLTFNTVAVIDMSAMFNSCYLFNSPITFTSTASVMYMNGMFVNCPAFNQPINFNTSSVTVMNGMFAGCTVFNQPLLFNTINVTDMNMMFLGATAFKQNIGSWNISNVADFTDFMVGKTPATWPTTFFNNLLCGWSPQIVQPGLTINFGLANYTNATGGPCYTILDIAPNNWTINSGGGI